MNSVRSRILTFFSLFAFVALFAIYISNRSARILGGVANTVINQHLPMVVALEEMEISIQKQDNLIHRFLLTGNHLWWDEWEKERSNYSHWTSEAANLANEPTEQDKLAQVDELYVQYDNQARQIFLTHDRNPSAAMKLVASKDDFLVRMQTLLDQMEATRDGMTIVRKENVRGTLNRHRLVAYGFLGFMLMCFIVLSAYLFRYLVQPLSLLLEGIRNFTRGNTDIQIPTIGKDELGELQEAFNEMSRELMVERKKLKNDSQSDALTGLFNMRFFRTQLSEEFSRSQRYGRPLTLLLIDVDNFKAYNDRNGHPAGDIVLKEVSRIFIRNVRGTDIIARYGGEEFVVLLPETPLDSGVSVAEKIRRAVEEHYFPFVSTQGSQKITVSIGVASYPDVQVSSDQDLIEAADKALYAAKRQGRNRVVVPSKDDGAAALAVYPSKTSTIVSQ